MCRRRYIIKVKNSFGKFRQSFLIYGVLQRKLTLDFVLKSFTDKGFNKIHPFVLSVLRVAAYQLLFADKIPNIPSRILYLDTDTIMHGDISPVFETDIENYEFGAAIDFLGKFFIRYNYQNAGVLLLNMDKIRETGLFEKARNLVRRKKMAFPDQDALNKLVLKKKFISTKYNEQRMLHKKTVVHHFCKSIRWFPFFHTVNIKPWEVEKVKKVYKLHCYDDVLAEYQTRINNLKIGEK